MNGMILISLAILPLLVSSFTEQQQLDEVFKPLYETLELPMDLRVPTSKKLLNNVHVINPHYESKDFSAKTMLVKRLLNNLHFDEFGQKDFPAKAKVTKRLLNNFRNLEDCTRTDFQKKTKVTKRLLNNLMNLDEYSSKTFPGKTKITKRLLNGFVNPEFDGKGFSQKTKVTKRLQTPWILLDNMMNLDEYTDKNKPEKEKITKRLLNTMMNPEYDGKNFSGKTKIAKRLLNYFKNPDSPEMVKPKKWRYPVGTELKRPSWNRNKMYDGRLLSGEESSAKHRSDPGNRPMMPW